MLQELCFKGDFLFFNILNNLGDVIIFVFSDCGRSQVQSCVRVKPDHKMNNCSLSSAAEYTSLKSKTCWLSQDNLSQVEQH